MQLKAKVETVEALGSELLVHFSLDATRVSGEGRDAEDADLTMAEIDIVGEGVARVEPRARVQAGEVATFAVYPERMHFFDPTSELAIEG